MNYVFCLVWIYTLHIYIILNQNKMMEKKFNIEKDIIEYNKMIMKKTIFIYMYTNMFVCSIAIAMI